jgi:hypothetical protein
MGYRLQGRKKIDPLNLPCRKTMYNSREEALDMIAWIKENRGGRDLFAYQCTICGFWHLTSRPGK